jgi:hypothetical protein
MVAKAEYVKRGDLPGKRDGVHVRRTEEPSGRSQRVHRSDEPG